MGTPIDTNGYTHDGIDYDEKLVNSIGAERANEIKSRIDAELLRRRYYGSEYSVDSTASQYTDSVKSAWTYNESNSPKSGDRIQELQGRKIISSLLMICDIGDMMETNVGNVIPDDFQYEPISKFLTKLESEEVDGLDTSCRSACTGLCVGTCGSSCDGCTDQCTNMCKSSCGTCSTGCEGCSGSCSGYCEHRCTGECGGQCDTTCYTACTDGCYEKCYAACGGTCDSGCSGNCKAGPNKSTDSASGLCVDCYAVCTSGCKNQCSGTCGGNCKDSSTVSGEDTTDTTKKTNNGVFINSTYTVRNDITSNSNTTGNINKSRG